MNTSAIRKRLCVAIVVVTTNAVLLQGAGAARAAEIPVRSTSDVMADISDALAELEAAPAVDVSGGAVKTELPAAAPVPAVATAPAGTLTMDLPAKGTDLAPRDGTTAVFEGTGEDNAVAVQATRSGVRALIHIDSADAPERFEFSIGGDVTSLRLTADGGAEALDSDGRVLATAAAPWAIDAAGVTVPTHFEVHGATLVQVVRHRDGEYAYGIVADPDFIFVAKCTAAIALFAAENASWMTRFWTVFRSTKALIDLFRGMRAMSKAGKLAYFRSRLGRIAADFTGLGDLVSRCTP